MDRLIPMSLNSEIEYFLKEQNLCLDKILQNTTDITHICNILLKARDNGNKIFTIGNGGSGSTASHFVSDLLKTALTKNDKRFSAFSLVDNNPVILAWSNDTSYSDIFIEQLKNHLTKNDIVIGFSGSGNSKNILLALDYTKKNNAICIGFTGESGGLMKKKCDVCFCVPSKNMLTIESMHVLLCHCITASIRNLGTPIFKYE